MFAACARIAASDTFERLTLVIILINAALMGVDTNPMMSVEYEGVIFWTLLLSQIYFVIEIALRIIATGPRFRGFFESFWNRFDFAVVALSLVPAIGPFVTVARLLRLLRVIRLMTVSDRLRGFLVHTQRSIDEALYFAVIGGIFLYVFAVAGVVLFADIDAVRWGSLGSAGATLLYLALLQDIPAIAGSLAPVGVTGVLFLLLYGGAVLFLLINTVAAVTAQHLESRYLESGSETGDD